VWHAGNHVARIAQEVVMPSKSLEERMDNLEPRVEVLERLPDRVTALETQIVLLRDEMRSGFSATRQGLREEIRAGDQETRRTLREEIRAGDEETRRVLSKQMQDLYEANERHMRVLHEDLIQRISTIAESRHQ
jgi:hypothetical protein